MSRTRAHAPPRAHAPARADGERGDARGRGRDDSRGDGRKRGDDGRAEPRIVECKPRRGDVHPLSAAQLRRILARVPSEQRLGLARIELRARTGSVGKPFAEYRRDERVILLYSLPADGWWLPRQFDLEPLRLDRYQARVTRDRSGSSVTWRTPTALALWFWIEVLAHELGHHVRNQHRARYPRVARTRDEESVADLYSRRAWAALLRAALD
jgi:hypothetical protein